MTMTIELIKLNKLVIDEELDFRTTGADIESLAQSMADHGLMQPITVAPNGDGKYHVVAGRRRLRAAEHLGWGAIDAVVRDDMDSERAQVIGQIIENLHREDVSLMDEARAFAKLGSFDLKQAQIAEMCSCSPSHVSARLALLKLPPQLVSKVERGTLPSELATKIARLPKDARDDLATMSAINEATVSRAQADHDQTKARNKVGKELADQFDLPVAAAHTSWGYARPDEMAKALDLDDLEDGFEFSAERYDIDVVREHTKDFKAACKTLGALGLFVTGAPGYMKVNLVYAYDSAKELAKRKAEAEEYRAKREAEEAEKRELHFKGIAPLVENPPKSLILTMILMQDISDRLNGFSIRQDAATQAAAYLELDTEEAEPADVLLAFAGQSVVNACRVWVLLHDNLLDPELVRLGALEGVEFTDHHRRDRDHRLRFGSLDVEDLPEAWQVDLPEMPEPEPEVSEDEIAEAIDEAIAQVKADNDVDELDQAEIEAIEAEVRASFTD